jgi:hypothetical protein
LRIITDPFAVGATVRIEFDSFDGFMFANRPGASWPLSTLRNGPDNKSVTLDSEGDLIDSENTPTDTPADELSAFIEYALSEARERIDTLLTFERQTQEVSR